MKSRDKCQCSPPLPPSLPALPWPGPQLVYRTGDCCQFLRFGQFEILQPASSRCSPNSTVSPDKHINQSILAGRQEESAPWSDHQPSLHYWLREVFLEVSTGAWISIISAGWQWTPTVMLMMIYFITHYILWSNWDIIATLQLISSKGCRTLTRLFESFSSIFYTTLTYYHRISFSYSSFLATSQCRPWWGLGIWGHLVCPGLARCDLVVRETPPGHLLSTSRIFLP